MQKIDWQSLRNQMCLNPELIQLNAGSCSPISKPVWDKAQQWRERLASDPMYFLGQYAQPEVERSREKLGAFLSCSPKNLLFFPNISHALNLVLQNFPFQKGASILTTSEEYPHYWTLFKDLEKTKGCRFERVRLPFADQAAMDPKALLDLFKESRTPDTQALFISHVSCQTGLVLPIQMICDWANSEGLDVIIDGAHAAGAVPLDLDALGCAFYAANIHKWMMGLTGSAFLYADSQVRHHLRPFCFTAAYPFDFARADELASNGASNYVNAFEYQGTRDQTPSLVVSDVIEFYQRAPVADKQERYRKLRSLLIASMADQGFKVMSQTHPELSSCLTAFYLPIPNLSPNARHYFRSQHKLEVNFPYFEDGQICLRVCTSWFNNDEEIARAAKILGQTDWTKLAK